MMVGKGEFPFKELVARLKDVGYDGPLIIEQYAGNYDSIDEVKESVEYLKTFWRHKDMQIKFDFNNMMESSIGEQGITEKK